MNNFGSVQGLNTFESRLLTSKLV